LQISNPSLDGINRCQALPPIVFEDDKLFDNRSPCDCEALSPQRIDQAGGSDGIAKLPFDRKRFVFKIRTIDSRFHRVWASIAADPIAGAHCLRDQWKNSRNWHAANEKRHGGRQTERGNGGFFWSNAFMWLLLSVTGIEVVSGWGASREAGRSALRIGTALKRTKPGLIHLVNSKRRSRSETAAWLKAARRLRAACVLVAKNLIKCQHLLSWACRFVEQDQKICQQWTQCRIANRSNRIGFPGRQR